MKKDKSRRLIPFYPDSMFKMTWDMFGLCFIIYQSIVIPYRFCFKASAEGEFKYLETIIDFFFMFDVGKNFISIT